MDKRIKTVVALVVASAMVVAAVSYSKDPGDNPAGATDFVPSGFVKEGNQFKSVKHGMDVQIGDFVNDKKPHVNIKRQNHEASLEFFPQDTVNSRAVDAQKIRFEKDTSLSYEMYERQDIQGGGLEVELVLSEYTGTSTFTIPIKMDGLEAHKQLPLDETDYASLDEIEYCTQTHCYATTSVAIAGMSAEEQEEQVRVTRPENVVNSYALYYEEHASMLGEYQTGKHSHILRIHSIDDDGNEHWGDMFIEDDGDGGKQLRIEADPDNTGWMVSANYPVKVDPTVGYAVDGASYRFQGSANVYMIKFTMPEDGTIDSCSFGAQDALDDIKMVIFASTTGAIVQHGIGEAATPPNTGDANIWATSTPTTSPSLTSGTSYLVGAVVENFFSRMYYDTFTGQTEGYDDANNSFTTPKDISFGSFTYNDERYSRYCTYTATGGGGGDDTPPLNKPIWFD